MDKIVDVILFLGTKPRIPIVFDLQFKIDLEVCAVSFEKSLKAYLHVFRAQIGLWKTVGRLCPQVQSGAGQIICS